MLVFLFLNDNIRNKAVFDIISTILKQMLMGRLCFVLGLLCVARQLNLMPSLGFSVSTFRLIQPRSPFGQIPSPTPPILPPTTASTSSSTRRPTTFSASSPHLRDTASATPTASIISSISSSSISTTRRFPSSSSSTATETCRSTACPSPLSQSQRPPIPTSRWKSTVSLWLFSNRTPVHIDKQCYLEQFEDQLNS